MRALIITRTVLVRILSSPSGIVGILAALSAWPLLLVLAPTGISSSTVLHAEWSYEVAFIGQAVGVLLGLSALERIAPVLAREAPGNRLTCEWFALCASGLIGAVLVLLPGLVYGVDSVGGAAGTLVARVLPSLTATAAGGVMISRLCPVSGVAPWLLASCILLAPMIHSQRMAPHSLVSLTAGIVLAAWLLDRAPLAVRALGARRASGTS